MERLRQRLNRKSSEVNESWAREQELQDRLQQMQSKVCVCVFMQLHPLQDISLQSNEFVQRIEQLEGLLRERNISLEDLPPISIVVPVPPPAFPMPPLPPPLPAAISTQQPHAAPGSFMLR